LQAQWKGTEKKYVAVVYGQLAQKEGMITSYLSENKAYVVYSTTDVTKGKLGRLRDVGSKTNLRRSDPLAPQKIGCPLIFVDQIYI
jgi:23S rRNA-/tRNA-specific pseudouridylate synthase